MALPNDKISTTLVANTLGTSSRDVGTLCTHQAINKWSKWKPVRFNTVAGLTEPQLQSTNYGLRAQDIPNIVVNSKQGGGTGTAMDYPLVWTYAKPRGAGYNEPYRLGDFRNYNHIAVPTIKDVNDITITQKNIDDYFLGIDKTWYPSFKFGPQSFEQIGTTTANMEIHLYMLEIIAGKNIQNGDWRMGLAIWHPTEKQYYIASSPAPISSDLNAGTVKTIFVSLFNQSTQVRNLLFDMKVGDTFQAIPFLGYQLYKNNGINEFYFMSPNGMAYNFPEGETISISRLNYTIDTSITFFRIQTAGTGGYTGGVFPASTATIQGNLNKLPGVGDQGIRVKFDVTKQVSMMAGTQGSYIVFYNGTSSSSDYINIPISKINGLTTRQTLAVGTQHEVEGSSSQLRDWINAKTNPTGQDQYLMGRIKIIDEYIEIGTVDIRYMVTV